MTLCVVQTDLFILELFKGLNEKITSRKIQFARIGFVICYCCSAFWLVIIGFAPEITGVPYSIAFYGTVSWIGIGQIYDTMQIWYLLYLIRATNKNKDKETIIKEFGKVKKLIWIGILFDWVGMTGIVVFAMTGLMSSTSTAMPVPIALAGVHAIMSTLIYEKVRHLPFAGRPQYKQFVIVQNSVTESKALAPGETKNGDGKDIPPGITQNSE
jgi:hypothetical protein